jgi:hypothetical protein
MIFCATTRPTKSEVPPGAKGLMMMIGLVGYCALTEPAAAANAAEMASFANAFIVVPSFFAE